jgi:hypothetical protein
MVGLEEYFEKTMLSPLKKGKRGLMREAKGVSPLKKSLSRTRHGKVG